LEGPKNLGSKKLSRDFFVRGILKDLSASINLGDRKNYPGIFWKANTSMGKSLGRKNYPGIFWKVAKRVRPAVHPPY
jgi:hypothetical protein